MRTVNLISFVFVSVFFLTFTVMKAGAFIGTAVSINNPATLGTPSDGVGGEDALLLEGDDYLLLESGDRILLE